MRYLLPSLIGVAGLASLVAVPFALEDAREFEEQAVEYVATVTEVERREHRREVDTLTFVWRDDGGEKRTGEYVNEFNRHAVGDEVAIFVHDGEIQLDRDHGAYWRGPAPFLGAGLGLLLISGIALHNVRKNARR